MQNIWFNIKTKSPQTPEQFISLLRQHIPDINSYRVLQWEQCTLLRKWEKKICLFVYFYLIAERYKDYCGPLHATFQNDLQNQIKTLWPDVKNIMAQQAMEDAFEALTL